MKKYYFLGFLLLILKLNSQIFVTQSGAGNKSGTSWANAATLQNAIANYTSGDQLWLRKGTYNITQTLEIGYNQAGIKIYGGFAGNETALNQRDYVANVTILDGLNQRKIIDLEADNVLFDGLTFTKGFVTGDNDGGAAIFIWASATTIKNCTFRANNSEGSRGAGALYVRIGDNHLIENCLFENNKQVSKQYPMGSNGGGAIHVWTDNVVIKNSTFKNNQAGDFGGAIYTWGENLIVQQCTFENNHSDSLGGAIHVNYYDVKVSNSIFKTNSANSRGGAINNNHIAYVTNSLFDGNTTTEIGGAIYNQNELYMTNSTLVNNNNTAIAHSTNESSTNVKYVTHIFNSIFYNNTSTLPRLKDVDKEDDGTDESTKDFRRNIFQENTYGANNLVGINPQFQNFANGNFKTVRNSPGHNFGNAALYNNVSLVTAANSQDLAGKPRLFNNLIDLGAYEIQETLLGTVENENKDFSIYPNPVIDEMHITKVSSDATYSIVNLNGQQIAEGKVVNNQLDLRTLEKGVYIITIEDKGEIINHKFIKK